MITNITKCIQAEEILQQCQPLIEAISQHPVYQSISTLAHLRIFTEHHVFAVWDFICLLKELHRRIVCTQAPAPAERCVLCAFNQSDFGGRRKRPDGRPTGIISAILNCIEQQ